MSDIIPNMDPIDEVTVRKDSSNTETGNSNTRFKRCMRKGDTVYYTDEENIHMVNKSHNHEPTKISLDSQKSMDRLSSGESLYKTFTFTQSLNDEDTEKCIAFWKSVMEKNLEPVKCSIIENRAYQPEESVKEEPCEVVKIAEPEIKKEEVNIEEQIDEKLKLVHKEYRDMWDRAIKQMQKQKLDKIKLVKKARCKMCETLDAPFKEDICGDPATIDKEIKDLNKWKSTARKKAYATGSSTGPRTQQEKPKQKPSSKLQKVEKIHPSDPNTTEGTQKQDILEETVRKIKPPPDTNTYEFVDAIENKRQSGKYSEWRSNSVQETCNCGYEICRCNTNPAIKDIIPSNFVPSSPVVKIDKTTRKTAPRVSVEKVVTEKPPRKSSVSIKSEDMSIGKGAFKKPLSVLIHCDCSSESCDCEGELQMLSRTQLPEEQWEIPKPPEIYPLSQKRSSLEIYRQRLSLADPNMPRSISGHAVNHTYEQDRKYQDADDTQHESIVSETDIHPPSVANDDQATYKHPIPESKSNLSVKKGVSLVVQGCGCGTKDCDCFVVEEVTREMFPSEVYTATDNVPKVTSRPMTERLDSLELAKGKSYLEQKQSDLPITHTSPEESTAEIHHKPVAALPIIPYEHNNLQVTESKIVVQKDSIQLTRERSNTNWGAKKKYPELKKDKQCYEQIGEKSEDTCGKRGKRHSINLERNRSNLSKILKQISFTAKTCRCTNSRCDCYNVLLPEKQENQKQDQQDDKANGTESEVEDEEGSLAGNVSKGSESDKASIKVILAAMQQEERKDTLVDDVNSLAASQFLDFNSI